MKNLLLLLLCAVAWGQPPSAPAFECVANANVPPTLRAEGITELVGDLLLQCTGGTPTPAGQNVPTLGIKVTLSAAATSRIYPNGTTDALLIVDEPKTATNPAYSYLGCATVTPCPIVGNGTGLNQFNGTPGHPNIFPGTLTGPNEVTFFGIPFDPPGANSRTVRITNVRVNANAASPAPIIGSISVNPSTAFSVSGLPLTLGTIQPGLSVGIKASTNQFCSSLGLNGNSDAPSNGIGTISFKENFGTAFRTRIAEGGFSPPLTAGLSATVGTADSGTLLGTTFYGFQPGLTITLPGISNIVAPDGTVIGTVKATSPTGTVAGNNLVLSGNSAGSAQAVWEVVNTNPVDTGGGLAGFFPTFTVGGSPTSLQVPLNIQVSPRFVNPAAANPFGVQIDQNNLLYPFMTNLNKFATDPLPSNTTADPLLIGATIVPCVDSGGSLNTIPAQAVPQFIDALGTSPGPGAIFPRVFNVPVISSGLPTTGVTVTANPPAPWLNVSLSDTTTPLTTFLSVNASPAGKYSTTLQFNGAGGNSLSLPVNFIAAVDPWFTRNGFAHSASYVNTVVSPGQPFVIFGGNAFGPPVLAGPALDSSGRVVTMLGNTQVLFDGTPAPLYYVVNNNGIGQAAGFAPFELAGKTVTSVQVVSNNQTSPAVQLAVLDAVPGLFTADSSGGGQGAILNQDLSVNSTSNPEAVGNVVVLFGGGAGQTAPGGRDGGLAGVGGPLAQFTLPLKVFIDGIAATNIQYGGPAPGLVEGVFQVNVQIPAGVRTKSNVPVMVVVDGKRSQPGVTLATK